MSGNSSARNTDSYGSIVEALRQELEVVAGQQSKSYPYNYRGITEAIQSLTFEATRGPGSDIGPSPSNGSIIIDNNGDPQWLDTVAAADGTLWFDTRQGRLFISYQEEWYQTNGGDGLPIVTPDSVEPSASNLPIGQFWWDAADDDLYIFEGTYRDENGAIVTVPTSTTTPVWIKITLAQGDYFQNSQTLPLYGTLFKDEVAAAIAVPGTYFPTVDPDTLVNQQNANLYLLDVLEAFDEVLGAQGPFMSIQPPANPVSGQFWYDTAELEMSIWYLDANGNGQWVPVSAAFMYDEDITALKNSMATETANRTTAINTVTENVDTIIKANTDRDNKITSLQGQINNLPTYDLTEYVTKVQQQLDLSDIQAQVDSAKGELVSVYKDYATKTTLNTEVADLNSQLQNKASVAYVNTIEQKIPNVSGYATTSYVNSQIQQNAGIKATGDMVTGTLTMRKDDTAKPAFDFSQHYYHGYQALKFETNCPHQTRHQVTFGTNEKRYEYNWDFSDREDFCWTHATGGKIASINQDNLAAKQIVIGDFLQNNDTGRRMTNTIDVGARLTTYQTAFTEMRSAISTSTDYASLKANLLTVLAKV